MYLNLFEQLYLTIKKTDYKQMKRIQLFLLIFLFGFNFSDAQINRNGLPIIRNFEPEEIGSDQNWVVVQDQRGVIYVGTNDDGVLVYDGVEWNKISIPNQSDVRSLMVDDNGLVYVGAKGEFGYLGPDELGRLQYYSLIHTLDSVNRDFKGINGIYSLEDEIYFCGNTSFYKYNPGLKQTKSFKLIDSGFKYGNYAYMVNGKIFIGDFLEGLVEFDKETFKKAPGGSVFGRKAIMSMLPYGESRIMILTHTFGSFIYDPETGEVSGSGLSDKANKFIIDNGFYSGIRLPGGGIALGTLYGGLLIVDNEGEILNIIGHETGMQNKQVTDLFINLNNPATSQLWVTLAIGITKIEVYSPIKTFIPEAGIESAVNDIILFNDTYYLATSDGVYYLTSDENGLAKFQQLPEISQESRKFLSFSLPGSSSPVLWVATIKGLYQINSGNEVQLMEEYVSNLIDDEFFYNSYDLFSDNSSEVFLAGEGSIYVLKNINGKWYQSLELKDVADQVRSILKDSSGNVWAGTVLNGIFKFNLSDPDTVLVRKYTIEDGLPSINSNYVFLIDSSIYAATSKGLYKYHEESDRFEPDALFGEKYAGKNIEITRLEKGPSNDIWLSLVNADGSHSIVNLVKKEDGFVEVSLPFKRLPDRTADVIYAGDDGPVWIGISDRIFTYDPECYRDYDESFHSLILNVFINQDSLLFWGTNYSISEDGVIHISLEQGRDQRPGIKYRYNNMIFHWASPYFDGEEQIRYSFRLLGFDEDWSRWSDKTEFPYTNLPNGSLVFEVKSRNIYGMESSWAQYAFTILPPWYKTILAYFIYVIAALFLIIVIVKLYTRRLQLEKVRLEGIVARRTAEVVRQKEELEDSITYASRIQRAILPSENILTEQLPEHFLLFKPRDIVSGDFYWMTNRGDNILIVAADCTGHGVPGAFMSLLGISFLNEIVNRLDILKPDEVLNHLRQEIMSSLKQTGKEDEAKDGMDVAICIIDKKKMKAQFAGAYNPMWVVRPLTKKEISKIEKGKEIEFPPRSIRDHKNVLIPFIGDKMPIGISAKGIIPFTCNELDIKKGYSLYLFSDGYVDQFGGPHGKKFMSKAFKKLILEIQDKSMKEQERTLDKIFEEWKGDLDQVDDILVIGLKID